MRIDKLLTQLKYTSRSQARVFLKNHHIIYDHKRLLDPSAQVDPLNDIFIDRIKVFYKDPIYLMIHKPKGYLSAIKDKMHPCIIELLNDPYNRFDFHIVGRLDIDTTGLILLTTDGIFTHEITHPNKHVPKTYVATLEQVCSNTDELLKGVSIKDDFNHQYQAIATNVSVSDLEVTLTITEGKFHQVKRMFEAIGSKVIQLKRISIGHLMLGDLPEGSYKEIRKEDIFD
ncbi:MAG: pseudouridine synthase [Acholeplasmataceae bacterium]